MTDNKIILFDGYCNFCNFWVDFVIKRDKKNIFKFTGLQSRTGREILTRFNLDANAPDTVILTEKSDYYIKSAACLNILKCLSSPLKIMYVLIILPAPIRDYFYELIARNRYKIFGKRKNCRVPSAAEKTRFLE